MRRMRMTHRCGRCRYYVLEGISDRCTLSSNTYKNWLGTMYKEHPDQKNLRGRCEHYEETVTEPSDSDSNGTTDGM